MYLDLAEEAEKCLYEIRKISTAETIIKLLIKLDKINKNYSVGKPLDFVLQ